MWAYAHATPVVGIEHGGSSLSSSSNSRHFHETEPFTCFNGEVIQFAVPWHVGNQQTWDYDGVEYRLKQSFDAHIAARDVEHSTVELPDKLVTDSHKLKLWSFA
jgi:hypothetical protein